MLDAPLAYLVTFRTYGTWLHGDPRGSVDRHHRTYGTPCRQHDPWLHARVAARCSEAPFILEPAARGVVEAALAEVCSHRAWLLLAGNVRTNHVHAVVEAGGAPERILIDFKAWSTRRLSEAGLIGRGEKVWSRHGSTRRLWRQEAVVAACDYVLNRQGDPWP